MSSIAGFIRSSLDPLAARASAGVASRQSIWGADRQRGNPRREPDFTFKTVPRGAAMTVCASGDVTANDFGGHRERGDGPERL
jgi:hypothetical protein